MVVGVTVGGTVGVLVPPGVAVFVGVEVGPGVLVGVGVLVALPEVTITNSGALAPKLASRLAKLMLVLLVVLKAKSIKRAG
jgi:hypothetical protein